jgi:SsrA-binding protein
MERAVTTKEPATEDHRVATNRRALHDYAVEDRIDAGLALVGPEVKSVRAHHVSLTDAHAEIRDEEVWLIGMHITPYRAATHVNLDPLRERKLLLQKSEIRRLARRVRQKGYTLIPLRLYFAPSGYAKVEIGLCRGKHQYDKREAIAERDAKRRADRALREVGKLGQERG